MGKNILIISTYPFEENIDGMIQRVKVIDDLLANKNRVYLDIKKNLLSYRFLKKTYHHQVCIYKCNYYRNFFLIIKEIIKSDQIIIHSIYNYNKFSFYVKVIRVILNKFKIYPCLILDVHGVVPEENLYLNKIKDSKFYSKVERRAFSSCDKIIFLNDAMKTYYLSKYQKLQKMYEKQIIPMVSFNVINSTIEYKNLKSELKIDENDTVIIYCGNTAKWQNVDLVVKTIKNHQTQSFKYIILTKNVDYFKREIGFLQNVIIRTVPASEVANYYKISHYGFILRDDNIVNRVSSPAKLFEYLYYGIVPIVKYSQLGCSGDYEKISLSNFSINLKKINSSTNKSIAMERIEKFKDIIL